MVGTTTSHGPVRRTDPGAQRYPEHPLAASVTHLGHAVGWMSYEMGTGHGAGWWRCDQALRDPDFFPGWRAVIAERLVERHGVAPDRTTAGYVLQWYLGVPAHLGALLYHSARRVPGLEPRRISLHLDPAVVDAVRLQPGRFWCLPDDPAAEHPDAVVAADDAALGTALRRQVVGHAARFLRVYAPQVRFGTRTLWAAVTDALDTGLLLAGRTYGSMDAGAADCEAVLAAPDRPLTPSTTHRVVDPHGRVHWTRRRGSCCFHYALPDVESACATCPRVRDDERARMLGELPAT